MAWLWLGNKPLSEPVLTQFTDAYICGTRRNELSHHYFVYSDIPSRIHESQIYSFPTLVRDWWKLKMDANLCIIAIWEKAWGSGKHKTNLGIVGRKDKHLYSLILGHISQRFYKLKIRIWWKFFMLWFWLCRSNQVTNLYILAAELLWHVQNNDMIWSSFFMWEHIAMYNIWIMNCLYHLFGTTGVVVPSQFILQK